MTTWFSTYVDVVMGQGLGGASTCLLIATAGAIVSYIPIGQIASKIGRRRTIQGGIVLLTICFVLGYVLTTAFSSINAIMFIVFALVGLAWAAINVNSLPMVVEMCKGSDIGKFTGYYYTASMAAQVVTPVMAGTLMRKIDYRVLFPYAALFVALSFVTMLFVRHGDVKAEAKRGWTRLRIWTTDPHTGTATPEFAVDRCRMIAPLQGPRKEGSAHQKFSRTFY